MTNCPCCSKQMLRHIRHHRVYWFCRSCWQEMPVMEPGFRLVSVSLEQHLVPQGITRLLVPG